MENDEMVLHERLMDVAIKALCFIEALDFLKLDLSDAGSAGEDLRQALKAVKHDPAFVEYSAKVAQSAGAVADVESYKQPDMYSPEDLISENVNNKKKMLQSTPQKVEIINPRDLFG